jgi:Cu+-exporting ATPase
LIGDELGIDEVIAEQTPEQKLQKITELNAATPTAMVGDGINDAPALAKATDWYFHERRLAGSYAECTVVLMNHGLKKYLMRWDLAGTLI